MQGYPMHVLRIHMTHRVIWKSETVGRVYFLNILNIVIFGDFA